MEDWPEAPPLPPVIPDVSEILDGHILSDFSERAGPEDRLQIHAEEPVLRFWERRLDPMSLLSDGPTPLTTTLKVDRDPSTGKSERPGGWRTSSPSKGRTGGHFPDGTN